MNRDEEHKGSRDSKVTSLDALRRRRLDDGRLASEALTRATEGTEARIDGLLDAVPSMLDEAQQRRRQAIRRNALTASIPMARRAIPRLAAVAAMLVAVSAALLLTGGDSRTSSTTSFEDLLIAGNGISDEMIIDSILEPEEQP